MFPKSEKGSSGAATRFAGRQSRQAELHRFILATAMALCLPAGYEPAMAQQYLGITRADQPAPKIATGGYSGASEMWWTSSPAPYQVVGTAGRAASMNRLHTVDPSLKDLVSRCYGWGGSHGTGTGQCINTDKDGDMWLEAFFCDKEVTPPPSALYACEGTITAIGGTGKYRNITGSGAYSEYILSITPDGMLVGYSPGHVDLTW